jgi:hypothetical protein
MATMATHVMAPSLRKRVCHSFVNALSWSFNDIKPDQTDPSSNICHPDPTSHNMHAHFTPFQCHWAQVNWHQVCMSIYVYRLSTKFLSYVSGKNIWRCLLGSIWLLLAPATSPHLLDEAASHHSIRPMCIRPQRYSFELLLFPFHSLFFAFLFCLLSKAVVHSIVSVMANPAYCADHWRAYPMAQCHFEAITPSHPESIH